MILKLNCACCGEIIARPKHEAKRNKTGVYYCLACRPNTKKEKQEKICSNCGKSFSRRVSPSQEHQKDFFCQRSCLLEFNAKTRAKRLDCKICNKPLKPGEGYSTKKARIKDFVCDSCRSKRQILIEAEKIKIKKIALENLKKRLDVALEYIKSPKTCIRCKAAISLKRFKNKNYCAKCAPVFFYHKKKSDHKYVISGRMRNLLNKSIKGKKGGVSWQTITGYSIQDLCAHLEKYFVDGMSWENMGEWHIDHIIPIKAFNYNSIKDPDFKRCWALSNLRPLWAKENISKSDKLLSPLHPSLSFYDDCNSKIKIGRPRKHEGGL